MDIRTLTIRDAEACDSVISTLPYHFRDPAGREACADAVRRESGLAAMLDGRLVGFVTTTTWFGIYAGTRRFYEGCGLEPLWEPDGWWNDQNQALLMQRRLP